MQLTPIEMDALKEVGNIGAGNAATSLSQMINRRIHMNVPLVKLLPFDEVAELLGGPETEVAGIYLKVLGDAPGSILFVLPVESGLALTDMLMGIEPGISTDFSEMTQSALMEIGNILAASYLNALADMTSLSLQPSIPALSCDMAAAIMSVILVELGEVGDTALVIETEFIAENRDIKGYFFLLPDPGSLSIMMKAIGVGL